MTPRFLANREGNLKWLAVVLTGVLALVAGQLERFRLVSPERSAVVEFAVTNGNDSGAGSLREGIFAADRAQARARIVIEARDIVVNSPMPPLVNPRGIVLDASRSHTRLIVTSTADAPGPVLDLAAANSVVVGLRIANAAHEAILVRAPGARVQDVAIEKSGTAIYVADGVNDVSISDSVFQTNEVGIQLPASAAGITIQNNQFQNQRKAAIWAVAPVARSVGDRTQLVIARNRFSGDARSILAVNGNARIEGNVIESARSAAVYASGAPVVIQANRMRAGFGFGIELVDVAYGLVTDNELDHNCAGGILVRGSRNVHLTSNRLYVNGTGIVVAKGDAISPTIVNDNLIVEHWQDGLHVIGSSPVISHNQLLRNRVAALRISTLVAKGERSSLSDPRLDQNSLGGNGVDEPQRDAYVAGAPPGDGGTQDCHWRLGRAPQFALAGNGR